MTGEKYQSVKTRRIMDDWREVPISQNEKKNIMIRSKLAYYPFVFFLVQKWIFQ